MQVSMKRRREIVNDFAGGMCMEELVGRYLCSREIIEEIIRHALRTQKGKS